MNLPTGTITFLFTDIEGSTRLWEQYPEPMRVALARHDALLREVIQSHEGVVFKTVGDAFCAAFANAPEALHAALDAQRALFAEIWEGGLTLRVRMALHTGSVEQRDNDYFGQPLNRIARLLSVGHGGQVLLSGITHDLTRDTIRGDISFQSLGEHRLRDLGRPQAIFQLLHPDLPAQFPPLRSLDNPELPHNLPLQLTSFIGREQEIRDIKALLHKTRLLTLTGSGGCGKTRLSLQVAAELLEDYPDGVWLVELASLADPALVPQALASVVGVREIPPQMLTLTLTTALKPRRLLIVLDNCEHLLDACVNLADALLRACPNISILASSRERLNMTGETTYRVPSLSLPDPKQLPAPEALSQYEAVRLFIERAQATLPSFVVMQQSAPALVGVCHRLDGIPLAIELAAARVRVLSVEEIHLRLDQSFRLLTGGSRTVLPRQQTLRALIDWSYNLLLEQEKSLLGRLSVFAGGWTLEAAERVCAGDDIGDWEVVELLTGLADKSLVVFEAEKGEGRYRLLETVRQYAGERLAERGEAAWTCRKHLECYLALGVEAASGLSGPQQAVWLDRLEAEHDNFRAALDYAMDAQEDPSLTGDTRRSIELGLLLAGKLSRFWQFRGHIAEGRRRYIAVLAKDVQAVPSLARAAALQGAGNMNYLLGDLAAAGTWFEELLFVDRAIGSRAGEASALGSLGNVRQYQGDLHGAIMLFEQSLTIHREIGDLIGETLNLLCLGGAATTLGEHESARLYNEQALALCRKTGNPALEANSLNALGIVVQELEGGAAARPYFEQSLAIACMLGDRRQEASSRASVGNSFRDEGRIVEALACFRQSLQIMLELGESRSIRIVAIVLEGAASAESAQRQGARAVCLWGAAAQIREEIGAPAPPDEQQTRERELAKWRAILGEELFEQAWARGRAMTLEPAIAYALDESGEPASPYF